MERAGRPELADFRRRLAEAQVWCASLTADDGSAWRTAALRPASWHQGAEPPIGLGADRTPAARRGAVDACVVERARLLAARGDAPLLPAAGLAGGRLLLYPPDFTLSDGGSQVYSDGFFDVEDAPPWDTWLCYVDERAPGATGTAPQGYWDEYLVSWVPPALLALAEKGIWANPVACLAWADDVDAPFVRQLRSAGVLG